MEKPTGEIRSAFSLKSQIIMENRNSTLLSLSNALVCLLCLILGIVWYGVASQHQTSPYTGKGGGDYFFFETTIPYALAILFGLSVLWKLNDDKAGISHVAVILIVLLTFLFWGFVVLLIAFLFYVSPTGWLVPPFTSYFPLLCDIALGCVLFLNKKAKRAKS